ncbi:MAG: F0F1 ATP synthase subunit A [Betaproteobacteria bacterium]|nr:MAG: F0F1 ATP synthase subunit A [Betaproteobacteria bacterium]
MLTPTFLTSAAITFFLALLAWASTRRLRLEPTPWQTALEAMYDAAQNAVQEVLPQHAARIMPFVATLWLFILVANLAGVIPGLRSPTADISTTAALAVIVFISVHAYGIRIRGLRGYLRHYVEPNPVMLPFHLISELSRTLALAVRLFGNIMSLELTALLVLLVAGFLVPVPVLMLHIVEALVQAYIFGMLALVYIGGALQAQEERTLAKEK